LALDPGRRNGMTKDAGTAKDAGATKDLKQKLAQQLDSARAKLDELKADIASMHAEDMESLRQKRDDLDKRLEQHKEQAKKMQADIASWKKEKVAHTQEAIASWRKQRELQKLQARADRAREYALDLVSTAAYDFEMAEQAVFDAVAARFDADAAATSAP
jgi:chromosome segregation ATPase